MGNAAVDENDVALGKALGLLRGVNLYLPVHEIVDLKGIVPVPWEIAVRVFAQGNTK